MPFEGQGFQMPCRWTFTSAVAAVLLTVAPCLAAPAGSTSAQGETQSRLPGAGGAPERGFSGAITTVIIGGGSSGYGGSVTAGTTERARPLTEGEERLRSDRGRSLSDRALPDSTPYGFNENDPFATRRDPFASGSSRRR